MKRQFSLTFLGLLSLIFLSACGGQKATQQAQPDEQTFVDAMQHSVAVPDQPQRIIASYLEDYLLALAIKPIAQWSVNQTSIQDYLQDELKDVPTIAHDLPYEKVLELKPDLLLIGDTALVEGGKYEQYSKIAPTYVVKNGEHVTWRAQFQDIAHVLRQDEKAQKVLADYDAFAAQIKDQLQAKRQDQSAAILWVVNNQAFVVSKNRSSGAVIYQDLGLKVPDLVAEISETATADWNAVSLEKLAQLDADLIFLINSDPSASLFQEGIWQNLPAVKENQVFTFGPESSWLYKGPIANTKIMQDIQAALF